MVNGPHDKVKLYDFTFLGQRFQAEGYKARQGSATGTVVQTYQGAGVCKELRDKLFDAQHAIYRAYALHEKSRGRTPSESGFQAWCLTPVAATLNTKPKFVASRLGWQFRKGNHSKGAAIDVDATYNPWVAVQSPPDQPSGGKLETRAGGFSACGRRSSSTSATRRSAGEPWTSGKRRVETSCTSTWVRTRRWLSRVWTRTLPVCTSRSSC